MRRVAQEDVRRAKSGTGVSDPSLLHRLLLEFFSGRFCGLYYERLLLREEGGTEEDHCNIDLIIFCLLTSNSGLCTFSSVISLSNR